MVINHLDDCCGRRMVVDQTVQLGDSVLDAGAGTGSTGILATRKASVSGSITFFDLSADMLAVAKEKVAREQLEARIAFETGDMIDLPFIDNCFDVVLSTYSLWPFKVLVVEKPNS